MWLHEFGTSKALPARVRKRVSSSKRLVISPVVLLEAQFLVDIGRVQVSPDTMLANIQKGLPLTLATHPFADVVRGATSLSWTRDPFDRMIVAQALVDGRAPLLTKDRMIREHYEGAVW